MSYYMHNMLHTFLPSYHLASDFVLSRKMTVAIRISILNGVVRQEKWKTGFPERNLSLTYRISIYGIIIGNLQNPYGHR